MDQSQVIYPIFLNCADLTLDPFWKDVFYNCAGNRFPKGMRIDSNSNQLYVKYTMKKGKTKTDVYNIPADPKDLFSLVLRVCRDCLNKRSPYDLQLLKVEMTDAANASAINIDCEWKDIKHKWLKEFLFIKFTLSLQKRYGITRKETKKLYNTIQRAIDFKKILPEHVVYENKQIVEITGLTFDANKREFIVTNKAKIPNKSDKSKKTQKIISGIKRFQKFQVSRLKSIKVCA